MIGYEHTGVRNIIQVVLLGHLLHTTSYTIPPLPKDRKKGNSQMDSSVHDNPAAPSPVRGGSFSQKI
jgi:hypothetical protein